ncbi:MAG: hypothetical protein ABFD49_11150 [Armatimonadota bacterium]|nr:hypothetical protein [bacterium]
MAEETTQPTPETTADPMKPVLKLRYPITFEGSKIEEICLDLMSLSGTVLSAARKRYESDGKHALIIGALSLDFCAYAAADAASLPYEAIAKFVGPDYYRVAGAVRDFLVEMDLVRENQ